MFILGLGPDYDNADTFTWLPHFDGFNNVIVIKRLIKKSRIFTAALM